MYDRQIADQTLIMALDTLTSDLRNGGGRISRRATLDVIRRLATVAQGLDREQDPDDLLGLLDEYERERSISRAAFEYASEYLQGLLAEPSA